MEEKAYYFLRVMWPPLKWQLRSAPPELHGLRVGKEWFPGEAVIKLRHAPASPGRLVKTQTAGPCLWNSLSVGLG